MLERKEVALSESSWGSLRDLGGNGVGISRKGVGKERNSRAGQVGGAVPAGRPCFHPFILCASFRVSGGMGVFCPPRKQAVPWEGGALPFYSSRTIKCKPGALKPHTHPVGEAV